MGAIVLDTSKVNSYVLPSLTKTKNTMQDAYSTSVSLRNSLPSSFNYRSTVNEISNQIYNIRREIFDIDTMISKKMESAKSIESKSESRASSISSLAAKIGGIAGTVAGAAVGASTGGVVGTAVGAVVGNKVGSAVGKGLANTGAKVVNGATKVAKSIWNGIKDIGKSIWNGCKKVAKKVASFVQKAVSGLVKAAKAVWQGLKWVGKQIVRTAATITNLATSLIEGVVSFVEAIGDLVLLVIGGVCSIVTAISDIIQGLATGEWNWTATKAVWQKWIMPWVGYDWTSKVFDIAYENRLVGFLLCGPHGLFLSEIDSNSYKWAKRGETGYKIGKGVGYYVGMIIATYFTAGAATAVTGVSSVGAVSVNTMSQGVVAASASLGKNTQKNYNATLDSKVKEHYISETMKSNKGLTLEEATAIVEENLENNVYSDKSVIRKNAMNNISGGEIAGNIGRAAGTAVIDGGIYFAACAAGDTIKVYGEAVKQTKKIVDPNTIKVIKFATKHKDAVSTTIKASKAYISEGYNTMLDGDEYDWKSATVDAVSVVIAENALRGVKGNDILKKGLYKSGSGSADPKAVSSAISKLTGETVAIDAPTTDAMAGFQAETSPGLFDQFDKITGDAVKKGIEKGEEKLIKDTVGGIYDVAVEAVGL